jgi:hypothetical protein
MFPNGVYADDFYGPSPSVTGYGADPPPANTAASGSASYSGNLAGSVSAPVMALVAIIVVTFVLYHIPTKGA